MNKFYFGGSDSSDSGDDTLPYPKPLARAAFLAPDFDATTFLSSLHNRHQTLEDLRAELRSRSQELNKELLDLVNEHYQDFLSLGGSLQGGEEKTEEVRLGLLGFRRDVEGLKVKVEDRKTEVEALVGERKRIHKDIQVGRTLLEINQRLSELEESLALDSVKPAGLDQEVDLVSSCDSGEDSDEEHGVSISRLQRHGQQLAYATKLAAKVGFDHPFVTKQWDRFFKIKHTVLLDLSTSLKQTNRTPIVGPHRVLRILEIYRDMGETGEAIKVLKESKTGRRG